MNAAVATMPTQMPRQIILTLDDSAVLRDVKNALRMIRGVVSLSVPRVKKNYYNSPEFYHDIDAAEHDILEGKGVEIKIE